MAGSHVLVDSSYYIGLLRQKREPLKSLAYASASHELVVCGIVRAEVGRAIEPEATLQRFQAFWNVMINIPTDGWLWEEVERTAWSLDRSGNILPLADIIIACCVKRADAVILTFDSDFQRIPGIRATGQLGW